MRRARGIVLAGSIVGALAVPATASADGGAYIELNETYYLPGDHLVGVAYVSVPPDKERLFERGPFYAYLLPSGASVREGHSLPAGAVRAGTFTVEEEKDHSFELRVAFTVPQIESGTYWMELCNDPCSIAGFREPLTGQLSVVATATEARLLVAHDDMRARLYGLRRQLRRRDAALKELQAQSAAVAEDAATMETRANDAETELEGARSTIASLRSADRPVIAPWGVWLIAAGLAALALAIVVRRPARPAPARGRRNGADEAEVPARPRA